MLARTIYGNPYASLLAGRLAFQAGPLGVALYRFAWANLDTGIVTNAFAAGCAIGFTVPTYRLWDWNRLYRVPPVCDCSEVEPVPPVTILRPGMSITLAAQGEFYTPFPFGAGEGNRVWINPADGTAADQDEGGFVQSIYTVMQNADCDTWARISSWVAPF